MLRGSDLQKYWFTRATIIEGGDIPIPYGTNGIIAVNIGAVIAFINGFPINPRLVAGSNGESWSIGGNFGEVLAEENLEITFGGAAGGAVFVSMKIYVGICR